MVSLKSNVSKKEYSSIKKTDLFNRDWYLSQYPDVSLTSMDPIVHYIKYGGKLRRKPSKSFDVDFYIEQIGEKELGNKNPLLHYLEIGKAKEYRINEDHPTKLEKDIKFRIVAHLWGGHPTKAEKELSEILMSGVFLLRERVFSGWHLARWYHFNEKYDHALEIANYIKIIDPERAKQKRFVMLYTFCCISLGFIKEAKAELFTYLERKPSDSDAILALSNINSDVEADKISYINAVYENHGLLKIKKRDESAPLSLHNITASSFESSIQANDLVSVIMPIYNAEGYIDTAIRGLLEQTWKNIEIIAVDDVSTDGTYEKLLEWSKIDHRVIPVRQQENGGAYSARNTGLGLAKGKYITTHDSDDWSHSQKIQIQVEYLIANSKLKGVMTHWIRSKDDLTFTQNWRLNSELIHWSHSSFLFDIDVIEKLGGWDRVVISGDTEFIWRVEKVFGSWSVKRIHKSIPLSFALDEETSLTRTKSTHVKTIHFGLRYMYREASRWWHSLSRNKENIYLDSFVDKCRPFPVPNRMVSRDSATIICDELISGDFSQVSDCAELENYLISGSDFRSKSIAVFHWPSYSKRVENIREVFFELVARFGLKIVVIGEAVSAKDYIIVNESLLESPLDSYPEFKEFNFWKAIK